MAQGAPDATDATDATDAPGPLLLSDDEKRVLELHDKLQQLQLETALIKAQTNYAPSMVQEIQMLSFGENPLTPTVKVQDRRRKGKGAQLKQPSMPSWTPVPDTSCATRPLRASW